jgi:hypothetical protein
MVRQVRPRRSSLLRCCEEVDDEGATPEAAAALPLVRPALADAARGGGPDELMADSEWKYKSVVQ